MSMISQSELFFKRGYIRTLMVELKHASHCVYKIRYYMVLCIKYRKKLLYGTDRIKFFKEICTEIGKRYWFEFDALGTDGDHVHVFVGAALHNFVVQKTTGNFQFLIAKAIKCRK